VVGRDGAMSGAGSAYCPRCFLSHWDAFLDANYPSALSHAIALDHKIASDAIAMSSAIGLPSAVARKLNGPDNKVVQWSVSRTG
jgi:hypothetical protein